MNCSNIIKKLDLNAIASREELLYLLENMSEKDRGFLYERAREKRNKVYGKRVYIRGLLEITSYCSNACKYCGINKNNLLAERYRLTHDEIIESCKTGYELGFRTFVLQGGEDRFWTGDNLVALIKDIKDRFVDVAVTLSLGEQSYDLYKKYYEAGADRYLLRHETANENLFEKIHEGANFITRRKCLEDLKSIGYQVGAGFMVGIPGQTKEDIVGDLLFLKELGPAMVGIGPFIPHEKTVYRDEKKGETEEVLNCLALTRMLLPEVLLPATTALSTIDNSGREKGLNVGCNVIMPNLSPMSVRHKYNLYENKAFSGSEAAESIDLIREEVEAIGLMLDMSKGDNINWRML